MWFGGKTTSEEAWVLGSDCWVNLNKEKKWINHQASTVHQNSINFLYNQSKSNIGADVQARGKAYLEVCQESNRHFLLML